MNFRTLITLNVLISFACFFSSAQAQVLSPEAFMGKKPGSQYTPHHVLVDYFKHVANAVPGQVRLVEYGRTNENRPLMIAAISSPENLAKLEQLRLNNLKRVGLVAGKPDNTSPVVFVWLACSVHGNEASGSESATLTLYELVNPTNSNVRQWLKNTVVLLDPSVNPDGYNRFSNWFIQNSNLEPNVLPESREHQEPWPGGRVNHYYFDLNRDWGWATQVETKQRLAIYKEWMPHVVADLHEMYYSQSYYFAPAAQPYHRYITPWQASFQTEIGKNNARNFDQHHWLYFTKEIFDLFYPSYGDTYPTFNGAIGMTYEQAGNTSSGRAIRTEIGDTLSLEQRILRHHVASLSTIEATSNNAERVISNFTDYYQRAANNPQGEYKTYIVKASNDPNKLRALCTFLDLHKIRYGRISGSQTVTAFNYQTNADSPVQVNDKDLVISAFQPMSVLAQVLFDPVHPLTDSLTYDITAWSLPYAYGLEAYAAKTKLVPEQAFEATSVSPVPSTEKPYAYLASWKTVSNARFLGEILRKGIRVRVATESFVLNQQRFEPGTLVLSRADNSSSGDYFDQTILAAAAACGQQLAPVTTGLALSGKDLGSGSMQVVTMPRVALLFNDRVDDNAVGHIWHYFEQDIRFPLSIIHSNNLGNLNLNNYNLIILPNGGYDFNTAVLDKLKSWIGEGGCLVALEGALSALDEKPGFNLNHFPVKKDKEEAEANNEKKALDRRVVPFGDRVRLSIAENNPGAIVKYRIDQTHPLGFGLGNHYYSLKTSMEAFPWQKDTWNVGYTDENPEIIGFMGSRFRESMKRTSGIAVQQMGRGAVVYLTDSPLFRGFWYQGKLLFSNVLFFSR